MKSLKLAVTLSLMVPFLPVGEVTAQEQYERPQITIGNGEKNSIEINGMKRAEVETTYSHVRSDGENKSTFRSDATALIFPEVVIENPGWIVLHPVMGGRPDGNVVAGYAYVGAGKNKDVTVKMSNRARAGDQFIVMLHSDVNKNEVLDFVFVEDGLNVEDRAVFEGSTMIAHMITVPE